MYAGIVEMVSTMLQLIPDVDAVLFYIVSFTDCMFLIIACRWRLSDRASRRVLAAGSGIVSSTVNPGEMRYCYYGSRHSWHRLILAVSGVVLFCVCRVSFRHRRWRGCFYHIRISSYYGGNHDTT